MNIDLPIQPAERAHVLIERQLRLLIEHGELLAGQRLPSTLELARQWKVSCSTVQTALAHLAVDGLVERRPRSGTFVRRATDRAIIGIIAASYVAEETAYYFRSTLNAFRLQMEPRAWTCRVYDGIRTSEITEYGKAQRQHLTSDLRNYRFTGLIEHGIRAAAVPEIPIDPALPRVFIHTDKKQADVMIDAYRFGHDAVDGVARGGRRQIVYLRPEVAGEAADLDGLWDAVHQWQLPAPRIVTWQAKRGYEMEKAAYQRTVDLLRAGASGSGKGPLPDALIVADDVAMRGVALALVQQRVPVPKRLLVLTQANEGIKLHYGIPVIRYEISPNEIARQALDILWKRIAGEPLPPLPVRMPGRLVMGDEPSATSE